MGHEFCYFCHHDFDRHECYPLFGKYYICQDCQKLVTGVLREFVRLNKTVIKDEARPTV